MKIPAIYQNLITELEKRCHLANGLEFSANGIDNHGNAKAWVDHCYLSEGVLPFIELYFYQNYAYKLVQDKNENGGPSCRMIPLYKTSDNHPYKIQFGQTGSIEFSESIRDPSTKKIVVTSGNGRVVFDKLSVEQLKALAATIQDFIA